MICNGKVLALVTARGGSKRLPRKNVLTFSGKPLIAWSIEAGLDSEYVDRLVVSTDDEEIAKISKAYGADVPFMRPLELASDTASSIDVTRHAIQLLENNGEVFDYLLLLQPTSPLRTSRHINEALELFINRNVDAVVSVTEVEYPVEWTSVLPDDLSLDGFCRDEEKVKRSQSFPKRYRTNGAIYLWRLIILMQENSFIPSKNGCAYIMERNESIDIDERIDFLVAEQLKNELGSNFKQK